MLRLLLFLGSLATLAGWGYQFGPARTSYSAYSESQLALLRQEAMAPVQGDRVESDITLGMLDDEQRRRLLVLWGLPLALVLGVAAWFAPRSHFSFGRNKNEEARLAAHLGNASAEMAAERRQAAATLLGVTPNAPASVIEAAFQAQLKERDRSRYDGVAVDLVRVAEEQREQLRRARDYLLQRRR